MSDLVRPTNAVALIVSTGMAARCAALALTLCLTTLGSIITATAQEQLWSQELRHQHRVFGCGDRCIRPLRGVGTGTRDRR